VRNGAYQLPDAYRKDTESNNYKLLQLLHLGELDAKSNYESIMEYRNLENAYGKTLDYYGEMIGCLRNGATDEQYRFKINGTLGRLFSDGTCNQTISLIADLMGVKPDEISIDESSMTVSINGLTISALEKSGYSSNEATEIIKEMLPIGIELKSPIYAGTLLVMGDVEQIDDTHVCSKDRNGNFQFDKLFGVDRADVIEKYPTLRCAAGYGMHYYREAMDWKELGLEGYADYSGWLIEWNVVSGREHRGGTLGFVSGEDA
jgi:hypothetical protein